MEVVAHMGESMTRKKTRTCYGCGKLGHVKAECCSKRTGDSNGVRRSRCDGNMVLSIALVKGSKGISSVKNYLSMASENHGDTGDYDWVLDNVPSRNLDNNPTMLKYA